MKIKEYPFDNTGKTNLSNEPMGKDWPVVYMIHNESDLYIGETTSAINRMSEHLRNPERSYLRKIDIIFDETYNKSVVQDFEQRLIKYCTSDKKFLNILNKNSGLSSSHNYYNRDSYINSFKYLWKKLIELKLARNSIDVLENRNIFKFSPYNTLTEEQNEVSVNILNDIYNKLSNNQKGLSIVNGCAGTGKTVLAISMINSLVNAKNIDIDDLSIETKNLEKYKSILNIKNYIDNHQSLKIGFVFPMKGIRKTIKTVFKKSGNGLNENMVLSPFDLSKDEYDILFVDEAHRLFKRKNLVGFHDYDIKSREFNLDSNETNQLDWVILSSKYVVLFYDKDQTIKGSDISYNDFFKTIDKYYSLDNRLSHTLETQMRCLGGDTYINYIKRVLNCSASYFEDILNYDFKLFDDVDKMVKSIQSLDAQFGLCRTLAGYSWPWRTKRSSAKNNMDTYNSIVNSREYDIDICGYKYIWNIKTEGWIDREDSKYTIGCIHTSQGYDLNYAGVIFGEEIDYDPINNKIIIDLNKFYDKKVKENTDKDTVKKYIINTYITMLARGIKGCYVYACNKNLQEYLKRFINRNI